MTYSVFFVDLFGKGGGQFAFVIIAILVHQGPRL